MRDIRFAAKIIGKFKSIQSAIFAVVTVLLLSAVLVITGVSMRYTRNSIFENSAVYTQNIVQQMNQNIDSYIDYMENIAYMISSNEDVQQYLFGENVDNGTRERLINQFKTILDGRSDIRNLGIIGSNGRKLINDGKQSVNPDLKLSTQEWYLEALQKPEGPLLTSSHVQHIISGERPWVITLSRGIRNFSNSGEKEGVFFIDLNYSAISELCDQNTIGKKGYAFILDESGNIVYHPQQQQLYNELQTENIDLIVKSKEDTVRTEKGNRGKLYSISRSNKTGWTVVGCMSVSELLRKSNQAQSIYVLISALLMIVALLFSRFLAKSLTYPLQRLRDSMSRVQEGHFDGADVEIDSENEIGSLTKSFNVMTHRIQDLMEQNVKEQEAKRKSELKALQSQINPHFLYNTLDSIIWMAEGRKYEEVVLMTASLARLLRQSISNEDEVVPLAREVEYAKGYLTIQKMRYKDKLEFEIDVEPSILNIPLIKLVLQPIIENAIYHGLKYKESKGLLQVKGFMKDGNAVLQVIDNGVGMDEETLSHIYDKHKVNYHSNGVGVYNVQKRLKLYYGENYGITYESEKGVGTTATITIPGLVAGIVYYKQVEEERKLSLIYIPKVVDGTNDFWTSLIQGAEMAAKEYNADIRVWAPEEENDVAGQNKLIERAIEEKPDAILISPSSFTESDQLLKKAKEQGIHIAFIDSYTQEEVQDLTVATDNLEAGQILGRFAKDLVGTDDQIAIVSHVKGVSTAVEREKGFRTGLGSLKDNIVDVVYCDSQYDKSYELTKELMKKYPDLKMIAGMNEYSSVGAARAVKAAKAENRIRVVGVDSSQEAVQLMEHGIFQGIVVQKAFKMGYVGVRETVKMLRGEDYKKNINSGCQLVTPDNMYTSEIEKLLFPFNTLKTYGDLTP